LPEAVRAGGAEAGEAEVVADSLVESNLRGHDSHGVMRIPFYVGAVKQGSVRAGAALQVERETPAAIVCDGGWGFGQILSRRVIELLMKKAGASGIACGTLRRTAHIGRLGEYARDGSRQKLRPMISPNTHGAARSVSPRRRECKRPRQQSLCMDCRGPRRAIHSRLRHQRHRRRQSP
jgi:uncharacterized oxidoreductase